MNAVLFRSKFVPDKGARNVYQKIKKLVNNFKAKYCLSENPIIIESGSNEREHWYVAVMPVMR